MFSSAEREWAAEFEAETRDELPTGVPTPDEVRLILETARPHQRDYLMSWILYATGLRRQELIKLLVGDVLWDQRTLFVRSGKGDKDRYVLLTATLELFKQWVGDAPPEQRLFRISKYWSDNNFKKYCEDCGLYQQFQQRGLRLSVHSMRHAFATHRYQRGLDFWTILALLGHTFSETTAGYLRTASTQIDASYAACNPFLHSAGLTERVKRARSGAAADGDKPDKPAAAWPAAQELAREFSLQPKAARHNGLPAWPTLAEMGALLERAHLHPQCFLLLRLLYATGLWLPQALALAKDDILWDSRRLVVRGACERTVCVDGETQELLRSWPGTGPRLFDLAPDQVQAAALDCATATGLAQRLAGIGRAFGVDAVRYAFATHCCLHGIDRMTLMNLLGHEYLGTTNVYFTAAAGRYLGAYDASSVAYL